MKPTMNIETKSKLKGYIRNLLFLLTVCVIMGVIGYSVWYHITNGDPKIALYLSCSLAYINALSVSMLFRGKSKFAKIVSCFLSIPFYLIGLILPWSLQFTYLAIAIAIPAILLIIILMFVKIVGNFAWSIELILFVSCTIAAIASSIHRYGRFLIKTILTNKFLRENDKVVSDYDPGVIRYIIYVAYFVFLIYEYFVYFYDNVDIMPEWLSDSFLVYIAYDQMMEKTHLIKQVNQKCKEGIKEHLMDLWLKFRIRFSKATGESVKRKQG